MAAVESELRRWRGLLPILGLFGLLLTVLLLMSDATENSARFSEQYSWLLLCATLGLMLLAVMIGYNLYRLITQYRTRAPGARLTLRLMILFAVIAATPVGVVYYFSVQFLQRGIDSWFDVRVEQALEDALELSRNSLDLRMRQVLRQTVRIAEDLREVDDVMVALSLDELRTEANASELTLFSQNGRIIATAGIDPSVIVPNRPPEVVLLQVRQGHDYVSLDPIGDTGFHMRAVVFIPARDSRQEGRLLQSLFPVTDRVSLLADSVQSAFDTYKELVFLRTPLKISFILTLSLVLLLGILAAFWAAFFSSRRLVEPISDLVEGTRAVAAGRYDKQLPLSSSDELGFLVQSFNQMTRNLAQARDTALRSQQLVEQQRAYLEAVLSRLSSGVLTLDHDRCLRTCNAAAGQLLRVDLSDYIGLELDRLITEHAHLAHFFDAIAPHLCDDTDPISDWRQEVTLFGSSGRQVLMCRGSFLPDAAGLRGGQMIVFDDITTLVQAERDAAWAEVARRLAHEIKNPLTPIQLATERIRHKYLKTMNTAEEGRILDRSTHTIIQQVAAMKDMVDAFNEYARPPQLRLTRINLNDFITEVLYLYRDHPAEVDILLDLDPRSPMVAADPGRLRQLLHNVVKNGIEAIKEGGGSALSVRTQCGFDAHADYVELICQDDGPGFPEGGIGDIFEPYVTTKPKGTGLGLAIVKKIVEEHGGLVSMESPPEGGARVVVRLPLSTDAENAQAASAVSSLQSKTEELG